MTYFILKRNMGVHFKSLTYVASVSAKDAVSAMQSFCGSAYHENFMAVNCNWSGLSRYRVYGLNLNYA